MLAGLNRRLERLARGAIAQMRQGAPSAGEAARQALFEAHFAGRESWSYELTTLLPDLLTWAGMVEDPLHYTDGPVPSADWIETDLARYVGGERFA